jgi:hypothetical protein
MKLLKLMLTILFIAILVLNFGLVLGIDSDDASVSVNWDNLVYYQGDVAPARITFTSNFSQPLDIYYVGVNFDWMSEDNFQGRDLSANPITVPSYGSYAFDLMVFQIPFDASVGIHEYFIGIDGSYGGSEGSLPIGFSWDSPVFTLQIQDTAQQSYLDLNSNVANIINQATELTYDSPEANNLISQALEAYNAANDYAFNNQFQQQQGQGEVLLMIVIIGVIAVLVIIIIFMLLSKRKKTLEKSDQPTLETET